MTERADVVVVGGGVMGLASAWALARAGHQPVVLEQFRIGHASGSSHGSTRIFRLAYVEVEWVRLAQEALRLWRELEAETGEKVLDLDVREPEDARRATARPGSVADPELLEHHGLVACARSRRVLTSARTPR